MQQVISATLFWNVSWNLKDFVRSILRIVTIHRPCNFFFPLFLPCKLFLRYFYGLCINLFWCISLCSLTASVWIREWQLFFKSTSKHIYSASLCEYILNVHKLRPGSLECKNENEERKWIVGGEEVRKKYHKYYTDNT